MKRLLTSFGLVVGLLGTGCALDRGTSPPVRDSRAAPAAEARLLNAGGSLLAQATAMQLGDGVRLRLDVMGMPAGAYGAHIHAVGRCDTPDFTTAGPHWNPTGQQHGKSNPNGMHRGDLPNLLVGEDGRGTLEVVLAGALVSGASAALLDADGASIVIHERPDDYRTDPSGNSGGRIACGVFG